MLLTSCARVGGSSTWNSPSTRRLPTWAGAGASSQPDKFCENSHSSGVLLPPPRRYRTNKNVSIATVPTAPEKSPPTTAPTGVRSADRDVLGVLDLLASLRLVAATRLGLAI